MTATAKPPIPSRAGASPKVRIMTPDTPTVGQTHNRTQAAVDDLERKTRQFSSKVVASLPIGATIVTHGLGRTPTGCSLTPTVASVSFAWAMTAANTTTVTITTVGVVMTNVPILFW